MIYFDNASTTYYKPGSVIKAVQDAMVGMGSAGRGVNSASLDSSRIVYACREEVASLFNFNNPDRVVFTANATQSLNIAINGLIDENDHVITTVMEHNSVLRPLYKTGAKLTILPQDLSGGVDLKMLEAAILPNTKAVICTHVSNLTGEINDVVAIGEICKKYNLYFILDVAQSAGCMDINMEEIQASILCFTGHKGLLGPQGTGGLCVANGVHIKPLIVGGSGINTFDKNHPIQLPSALEAGTLNTHGIAGLLAGIKYIKNIGISKINEHEKQLVKRLADGIRSITNVVIYGSQNSDSGAILAMNIVDVDSNELSDILQHEYDICTRSGGHCAPLMHQSLNTINQGIVRFSFAYYNTTDEVDRVIEVIKYLANQAYIN